MSCAAVQFLPFGPGSAGEPAGIDRDALLVMHGREVEQTAVRGLSRRARHRALWCRQAIELAEPDHWNEEPAR